MIGSRHNNTPVYVPVNSLPSRKKSGCAPSFFVVSALLALVIFGAVFLLHPSIFGINAPKVTVAFNPQTAFNAGQPNIYGKPSLSAAQMNAILAKAHSPAAGTGQALYDGSVKSGINDAFAMGVFYAESQYGMLGAAIGNHSLSNFTQNGKLVYYAHWSDSYTDFYTRTKAAGKDNIQEVLDALYIPGIVNILDLKKARANEPSLQLILSTMRKLSSKGE